MYFKLRDHDYEIESASVRLLGDPREGTYSMDIDINAKSKDEALDPEMRELRLYHNNGFETGVNNYLALKGKKFVWTSNNNERDEEAGFMYVQEHEYVTCGVIEILDVDIETIRMRWTGKANVYWDEEFSRDVPFETEFEDSIGHPAYLAHPSIWIDEDTVLHILNLEDVFTEEQRLLALYKSGDTDAFVNKWDFMLKLRMEHKGEFYDGEVHYRTVDAPCTMRFADDCPVKLRMTHIGRSASRGRMNFYLAYDE
ncbi:hypothetical protein [uncultured Ruminococcus sp.]|uniref:hypothetical protein n=1 Tax=uncultured Ruminococcus sp. TaxID=165186 RepID=UPI0025D0DB48|nr:hypothetical protein [uncultured Ruminococcus sp.]